jgi:hypothetical protein
VDTFKMLKEVRRDFFNEVGVEIQHLDIFQDENLHWE